MPITTVGVGAVDAAIPLVPAFAGPVLANDIVLILVEQASLTSPEVSPSAPGFAHALGSPVGPDTAGTVLSVLWLRAAGGETSVAVSGPSNHGVTRAITFRGVKATGNPWNVNPAVATDAAASATATWPAVVPTVIDCLICLAIATGRDAASTTNLGAVTNANLTSLTEQMDNWVIAGTGGGIGLVTGFKAAATTTGTSTATMGSTDGKALMTLALEPAGTPPVEAAGYRRRNHPKYRRHHEPIRPERLLQRGGPPPLHGHTRPSGCWVPAGTRPGLVGVRAPERA
jgi:hypothetical protein